MSFGLQTYDDNGNTLASYDSRITSYYNYIDIPPNPGLPTTYRIDSVQLGPTNNVAWVAGIAVSNRAPTKAWDMPTYHAWLDGNYVMVYSIKTDHVRVVTGRY